MYTSKTIKTELATITPETARKLLEQNTRNRNVSKANYSKVLEAMSNGEWELNGEAIKIARDGQILDGQHRLMVAAENDLSFQTLIVYGLENETQDTMDTGKSRTISDVLAINGYKQTTNLAAIVSGIIREERFGLKPAVSEGSSSYPVTPKQVLDRLEKEPTLTELVQHSKKFKKAGLGSKVAAILYYKFSSIDQQDADDFFSKLETGEALERGNPILVLRETLIRAQSSATRRVNPGYTSALTIKAWNKYRRGESVSFLRFTPGGANPETFPTPI